MKLPEASQSGSDFERCPSGNHVAVCYEVIDLGTQETDYKGEKKTQHKVWIGWETSHELMSDGRPFVVGKQYTLSSFEKAKLRQHLESWRGKAFKDEDFGPEGAFDIRNVIGVGYMLNVVNVEKEGKTYTNIEAVASLPKGMENPSLHNERTYLSLAPDDFDYQVFEGLRDWFKSKIMQSPEWSLLQGEPALAGDVATEEESANDPDIPF